jgi:molybdenum cofactor cytidylyltransferase
MGCNKLLFDLGGETVVRRAVGSAVRAGLDPVVAVLGHEAEAVRAALVSLPCRFVVNPRYAEGMGSSVCTGIAALPPEAAAAVVLLADMPFVSADMIAGLVARYRAGDALLILSDYDGVNAPPMLCDRALFDELVSVDGKGCGKRLRRRHPDRAATVAWPAAALADLDAPGDYERVKAQLKAS